MSTLAALLAQRSRHGGGEPLVTYYDLDSGERTELSAITFGNWVDKTANLMGDEFWLGPGARVELAVLAEHPGHWMSLVWVMACWRSGATATLGRPGGTELVVCGPDPSAYVHAPAVAACSLHPLGLGIAAPLPYGVVDYALEVRSQPDAYPAPAVAADALAWDDGERQLSQGDLVAGPAATGRRALVRPGRPWPTLVEALVNPVLTGGSAVVVVGGDAERVSRIAAQERVD